MAVQPPPPPPLLPVEVPAASALFLAQWITATLAEEARQRRVVATGVDDVISQCETAIAKLQEAAETLLQEPGDAAEIIYGDVFEVVPPGLDPPLLGPAARLVDALFNGSGPLAGAIVVAWDLVHDTFYNPPPEGGPIQGALRDLGYLIHVPHVSAGQHFTAYAAAHGFIPGELAWQLWDSNHALAGAQARVALEWLAAADREIRAADVALLLCQGEWEERLPPWERMAAAQQRLQQAISQVDEALVALRAMRDTMVELEQIVINVLGQAPPPPPPPHP